MTRFPAEWEEQSAVLIAWPHESGDFADNFANVEQSYRVIADTISRYQALIIVCKSLAHQRHIENILSKSLENFYYIHADYNDIWVRDTAFLTVETESGMQLLNFRFNGWGNKYRHEADNALNSMLQCHPPFKGRTCFDADMVLEGGSIETDGLGTLITTRQCLLNSNRNPT
ncbi:MAG: agmatine deiminase family protein, partial [Gammaproteobacteria bacterium]